MNSLTSTQRGFTIVELMITLTIASILLGISIPNFNTLIKNNRLAVATNETIGAFNFARTEAFKRGDLIHIAEVGAGTSWVVWADADADDVWDQGEEIRVWNAFPAGVSVTTVNGFIVFDSSGLANNAETVTVCDDRSGESGSQLDLLLSGSVSVSKISCG